MIESLLRGETERREGGRLFGPLEGVGSQVAFTGADLVYLSCDKHAQAHKRVGFKGAFVGVARRGRQILFLVFSEKSSGAEFKGLVPAGYEFGGRDVQACWRRATEDDGEEGETLTHLN